MFVGKLPDKHKYCDTKDRLIILVKLCRETTETKVTL